MRQERKPKCLALSPDEELILWLRNPAVREAWILGSKQYQFLGVCVCVCVCCKKNELGLQFVSPTLLCWDFPGDPEVKALSSQCRGKWQVKVKSLSRVQLFETPWTVVHQAPPSMGFSRQEYWSWLPFPSPRDLPNPGIGPQSPAL